MQFTSFAILACAAFAVAMPATAPKSESGVAIGNGSGNGNDSSKTCDAVNNGKVSCCNNDNSSDGGIAGLNGILGGSCEISIHVLECQNTQTQACCPSNDQTGLIPIGSICLPISA